MSRQKQKNKVYLYKNSKKKVYLCTKEVETYSIFASRMSLNKSEHCTQHHFQKMNCSRYVSKPSSHLLWDLVTRWSLNEGCCHFLSFKFNTQSPTHAPMYPNSSHTLILTSPPPHSPPPPTGTLPPITHTHSYPPPPQHTHTQRQRWYDDESHSVCQSLFGVPWGKQLPAWQISAFLVPDVDKWLHFASFACAFYFRVVCPWEWKVMLLQSSLLQRDAANLYYFTLPTLFKTDQIPAVHCQADHACL